MASLLSSLVNDVGSLFGTGSGGGTNYGNQTATDIPGAKPGTYVNSTPQALGNPYPSGLSSDIQGGGITPAQRSTVATASNQPAGGLPPFSTAPGATGDPQVQSLLQQILAAQQAQVPPVAQTLNVGALQAQANQAAQSQVNPLYTQQLNQYLQNEASAKAEQEQQNQLNIRGYQEALGNTLAQNTQGQQYAGEQNAMTQGNINAQAGNYQLNSGNAETQKIQALTQANGQAGLIGGGLGSQNLWMAENQKNIEDAQQQGQFQYNRNVANLETSNTFAQLAQSSKYAQTQEGAQEAQSNFNLNSYLRQQAYAGQQYQNALTAWQGQAQTALASQNVASNVASQIAGIANPGTRSATQEAYGSYLQPESVPGQINALSYQP